MVVCVASLSVLELLVAGGRSECQWRSHNETCPHTDYCQQGIEMRGSEGQLQEDKMEDLNDHVKSGGDE